MAARDGGQAGFTLVEVLVALAVTAAVITAIGLLMGSNARATRALERRAALISARNAAVDARLARVRAEIDLARLQSRIPFGAAL